MKKIPVHGNIKMFSLFYYISRFGGMLPLFFKIYIYIHCFYILLVEYPLVGLIASADASVFQFLNVDMFVSLPTTVYQKQTGFREI